MKDLSLLILRIILPSLLLTLSIIQVLGQDIVINEFMAKNETTIEDKYGKYSDWLELYNNTDQDISLLNYSISDKENELEKWIFPDITILSKSYLLVFCSGENSKEGELHTNFKISSSGESLWLSNSDRELIDNTKEVELAADESYSRIPDGSDVWNKTIPTPGFSNIKSAKLEFSYEPGFYATSIDQSIIASTGDTIYYTLDGSIPTVESKIYTNPIKMDYTYLVPNKLSEIVTTPPQSEISYKAWESPSVVLDKAIILRCASFKEHKQTSKVYTHTYFIDSTIHEKYDLPIISLITDSINLFDKNKGIYVPGVNYDIDDPEWTGNYFKRGREWEKDVHIEYFDSLGNLAFYQDAGLRIHGGKTRQASQKSFKLYSRKEYGKRYFEYPLLPQSDITKYKRFILRTTMGFWGGEAIIQDEVAAMISRNLDFEYQNYRPCVVFLNGEYWGIYTIREKIDEKHLSALTGIDEDSIQVGRWGVPHYNQLENFIRNNDLSDDTNYEYIKTQIDINNYIDYYIAELFFKNKDWPANNIELWRPTNAEGRWRWIFYDIDAGFVFDTADMLDWATSPDRPKHAIFLFNNLLKNQKFIDRFIYRYAEILNTEFGVSRMVSILDNVKKKYEHEVPHHILRWNYPSSYTNWESDIQESLLSFLEKRPCGVETNIKQFFGIDTLGFSCSKDTFITNGGVLLYPNPSSRQLNIANESINTLNLGDMKLFNVLGKQIYMKKNIIIKSNEIKTISLPSLPFGIYTLSFSKRDFVLSKKIIISQ